MTLEWQQFDVSGAEERAGRLSALRGGAGAGGAARVSLPAVVRAARTDRSGHRLLATCIDGSLHIIHQATGLTHSVRAGFVSTFFLSIFKLYYIKIKLGLYIKPQWFFTNAT